MLLDRFVGQRSDLSLGPLFASLMWQALQKTIQENSVAGSMPCIAVPDVWVAWPADPDCLDRCQCNPMQELSNAVARLSGRLSLWPCLYLKRTEHQALTSQIGLRTGGGREWGVSSKVAGCHVGLVVCTAVSILELEQVARALKVAGAQQVGVIAAARNASLWQNHTHVSCDPRSARNPAQYG